MKTKDESHFTPAALAAALSGDIQNVIAASTPGGIERQEAEGQRRFVSSATLPKQLRGTSREQLEKEWGVKFGTESDGLFVNIELPEGWKLERTDHSMWNSLLDDKGRERASIFYKAAFYDRDAFLNVIRRYNYSTYEGADKDGNLVDTYPTTHYATVIKDCAKVIHTIGISEERDYQKR